MTDQPDKYDDYDPPPPEVSGAPESIWLCYGPIDEDCTHDEAERGGDVSWCDTFVDESDVKYIRADRYATRIAERDALLAERDELAEGRDNIQQDLDGIVRKHAAMAFTCDSLQSENRELRRDKARMDWLTTTQYWSLYQDADAQNAAFSFLLIKRGCKFYGTARAAIDAAMQAQSEQEQKCK